MCLLVRYMANISLNQGRVHWDSLKEQAKHFNNVGQSLPKGKKMLNILSNPL